MAETLSAEERETLKQGVAFPLAEGSEVRLSLHPTTHLPVVSFCGHIMGQAAGTAADSVDAYLQRIPGYVILDASQCNYMSSTMLGFIARLALERHESGYALYVAGVGQRMQWLLSVLDMDDFFQNRDTVEEAASEAFLRSTTGDLRRR